MKWARSARRTHRSRSLVVSACASGLASCLWSAALAAAPGQSEGRAIAPDISREDVGAYYRFAIGPGVRHGVYTYRGPLDPGYGSRGMARFQSSLLNGGLELELGLGHTLRPGLGLALVGGVAAYDGGYELGWTRVSMVLSTRLMLLATYYPNPRGPWSLSWGIGVTWNGFAGSSDEIGAADNIVDLEPQRGPVASVGFGYAWAAKGVFEIRASYLRTTERHAGDESELTAIGLQLLAALTAL